MSLGSWMYACDIDTRQLRCRKFVSPYALLHTFDGRTVRGSSHADLGWLHRHLEGRGFHHRFQPDHDMRWESCIEGTRALVDYLEVNDIALDAPWTAIYVKSANGFARYIAAVVFAFKTPEDAVKARMFL